MGPAVDLVIAFRASSKVTFSKQQIRDDARKAEQQYSRLIDTLKIAGIQAVGRRGESLGHILIFISCPNSHVQNLVKRERHSDFLSGLPTTQLPSDITDLDAHSLAPADRIRLVHAYICSLPSEGGLGIVPKSPDWDLVESILPLHDDKFNENWMHACTSSFTPKFNVAMHEGIRQHYGDAVALYFSFLSAYTRFLAFPAALGLTFYLFGSAYSPLYSSILLLWSIGFVQYWRVRERVISLRSGTRGSFKVEKRRAEYAPGLAWWRRELRMVASVPVILLFAGVLAALLTAIFVFEAFVTHLYTGPGHQFVSFSPTILFVLFVPRLLALYQTYARRLTDWENHAHQSTHAASLTLKTFALGTLVAYLGLALSAFVYVPFGEDVMRIVQQTLFANPDNEKADGAFWSASQSSSRQWVNPGRLRDQMFAYTVTNQAVNTFVEVGLPFVLRAIETFRKNRSLKAASAKSSPSSSSSASSNASTVSVLSSTPSKKRVAFSDEHPLGGGDREEREFLERVRSQVALPEYEPFVDYSEMVMQFGYVALWSAVWPLAPLMSFLNNILEQRSDAFKMTVHHRRPIPSRTDTIGPWLNALEFLNWAGALTNSALVYIFAPSLSFALTTPPTMTPATSGLDDQVTRLVASSGGSDNTKSHIELLKSALVVVLVASHGYILVRALLTHLIEKVFWTGSREVVDRENAERAVKETFLRSVSGYSGDVSAKGVRAEEEVEDEKETFWTRDEGLEEIHRIAKEA